MSKIYRMQLNSLARWPELSVPLRPPIDRQTYKYIYIYIYAGRRTAFFNKLLNLQYKHACKFQCLWEDDALVP